MFSLRVPARFGIGVLRMHCPSRADVEDWEGKHHLEFVCRIWSG